MSIIEKYGGDVSVIRGLLPAFVLGLVGASAYGLEEQSQPNQML